MLSRTLQRVPEDLVVLQRVGDPIIQYVGLDLLPRNLGGVLHLDKLGFASIIG